MVYFILCQKFAPGKQQINRLQQGICAQMLRQAQLLLQGLTARGAVRVSAEPKGIKVGLRDRLGGCGDAFAVQLRACVPKGLL